MAAPCLIPVAPMRLLDFGLAAVGAQIFLLLACGGSSVALVFCAVDGRTGVGTTQLLTHGTYLRAHGAAEIRDCRYGGNGDECGDDDVFRHALAALTNTDTVAHLCSFHDNSLLE